MDFQLFESSNRQPLAEHYIHRYNHVASLFEYNVWNTSEWHRRADYLATRACSNQRMIALSSLLFSYNQRVGNDERTLESIKLLEQPETSVVIGGQQAGLYLGPSLVIHKALTIIQSARKQAQLLGRPVLPVFWIAGEDHDWDEVNHVYGRNGVDTPKKVRLSNGKGRGLVSISQVRIHAEEWEQALHAFGAVLEDTPHKREIMQRLEDIHRQSATLSDAFARMLVWLFGKHGLIVVDAADPALRQLESDMFTRLLTEQKDLNEALDQGKANIEALGYRPQVEFQEGSVQLFAIDKQMRRLLIRQGDQYVDKQGNVIATEQQVLEWATYAPEKLSNNVVTRPLMQEFLFPVLATVLGPAELAYWAMLKPAFECFNMQMPILLPRTEFTIIDHKSQKTMERFGLRFVDVATQFLHKKEAWLKEQGAYEWDDTFNQVKLSMIQAYEPLMALIETQYKGLRKLSERKKEHILEQIDYIRKKTEEAFKTKHDASLAQWDRLEQALLPLGKPQERVYPIWVYINEYGLEWIDALVEGVPDSHGGHYTIQM